MAALPWVVSLAGFAAIWVAVMRFFGAPITASAVLCVGAIVALVFALEKRIWWLAVAALAAIAVGVVLQRRESRQPGR